jgi:adenylate kinase family enzyme
MDLNTISLVQRTIAKRLQRYKEAAIYSVDTIDQLQYVRGQIKSLEDLQQELKDLLNKQELEDDNVHGETETGWKT